MQSSTCLEKMEIMLSRLTSIACLVCFSSCLQAGVIYQWVDDAGRTQMSDVVPAKYQKSAKQIGGGTSTAPMQSADDARQAQERIRAANAATASSRRQNSANYPSTPNSSDSSEADSNDCAALLRSYHKSLSCFGRYRNSMDNSMDPQAFKVCKEATDPTSRCGSNR